MNTSPDLRGAEPSPAQREWAALSRIAERHATTPEQRRRAAHPAATDPHEAARLVLGLAFGSISADPGEPAVDQADLIAALVLIAQVRADVDRLELGLLDAVRARGLTWQAIAQGMGLNSAQAVKQRHDRLSDRSEWPGPRAATRSPADEASRPA